MSSERQRGNHLYASNHQFNEHENGTVATSPITNPHAKLVQDGASSSVHLLVGSDLFNNLLLHREQVYRDSLTSSVSTHRIMSADQDHLISQALGGSRDVKFEYQKGFSTTHVNLRKRKASDHIDMIGAMECLGFDQMTMSSEGRIRSRISATMTEARVRKSKPKRHLEIQATRLRTSKSQKINMKQGKGLVKEKVISLGDNVAETAPTIELIVIDDSDDDEAKVHPKIAWCETQSRGSDATLSHIPLTQSRGRYTGNHNIWTPKTADSFEPGPNFLLEPPKYDFKSDWPENVKVYIRESQNTCQTLKANDPNPDHMQSSTSTKKDDDICNVLSVSQLSNTRNELKATREDIQASVDRQDRLRIDAHVNHMQYNALLVRFEELASHHRKTQEEHERLLKGMSCKELAHKKKIVEQNERIKALQIENTRLVKENGSVMATSAATPANRLLLSPAPSSMSSTEEEKTENVRKMYIRIKRRFDHLHKAASDISMSTESMDLSTFGEFGQYLRQLRLALEENS